MTTTADPTPSPDNSILARREDLAKNLERLGVDPVVIERVWKASADELALLEQLLPNIRPSRVELAESMPLKDYQDILERLADEYVGPLTGGGS
jgi:hypothetical protein